MENTVCFTCKCGALNMKIIDLTLFGSVAAFKNCDFCDKEYRIDVVKEFNSKTGDLKGIITQIVEN